MTVRLTQEKAINLKQDCAKLITCPITTIREVARVIGKIVSSFPGIMYGPLYYRELENDKSLAAKTNKGNFNASMAISPEAQMELKWWVNNVECSLNVLAHVQPQHQITTDASLSGWGACIWGCIYLRKLDIHRVYPSTHADFESRQNQREAEWMLDKTSVLNALRKLNVTPDIDLFASCINHQFTQCVAYKPDPDTFAIDAFSLDWSKLNFYAFPPFSVIPSVLSKMTAEQAMGVVVVPDWPTQSWHPKAKQMLVKEPILLEARKDLLKLPSHPSEVHPLWHKLNLLVCILSGKD